jgi:hypothetical protein
MLEMKLYPRIFTKDIFKKDEKEGHYRIVEEIRRAVSLGLEYVLWNISARRISRPYISDMGNFSAKAVIKSCKNF